MRVYIMVVDYGGTSFLFTGDIAATVTELLGVPYQTPGKSFAAELV